MTDKISTQELAEKFIRVPGVAKLRIDHVAADGSYAAIHNLTEGGTKKVSREALLNIDYVDTPYGSLLVPRRPGRPVGTGKPIKSDEEKLNRHTVRMTDEEWEHCQGAGDASKYIRDLIAKDRA